MNEGKQTNLGTAVVTGASSGIGKIYAERLAELGYDLLLIARRKDRLQTIAEALNEQFGVHVRALVADLGDSERLEFVAEQIAGDESITLLINNAGTSFVGPLESATLDQLHTLVNLNIVALTRLCMAILPSFKRRNRGTIVNIGSVVGFDGYQYTPIYGATKAYVQNLSRALQADLKDTDVAVQLVTPAATESEIWEVSGFSLSNLDPSVVMTTENLVDAALAGLKRKEAVTAPSVPNEAPVSDYFSAASALLGASQTGQVASRYAQR